MASSENEMDHPTILFTEEDYERWSIAPPLWEYWKETQLHFINNSEDMPLPPMSLQKIPAQYELDEQMLLKENKTHKSKCVFILL